jgi:hypothetical protein
LAGTSRPPRSNPGTPTRHVSAPVPWVITTRSRRTRRGGGRRLVSSDAMRADSLAVAEHPGPASAAAPGAPRRERRAARVREPGGGDHAPLTHLPPARPRDRAEAGHCRPALRPGRGRPHGTRSVHALLRRHAADRRGGVRQRMATRSQAGGRLAAGSAGVAPEAACSASPVPEPADGRGSVEQPAVSSPPSP